MNNAGSALLSHFWCISYTIEMYRSFVGWQIINSDPQCLKDFKKVWGLLTIKYADPLENIQLCVGTTIVISDIFIKKIVIRLFA